MISYQFLTYKGSQIAYLDNGQTSNELLVAFHGYADSAKQFLPWFECETKFRIIALDLPYHGSSSANTRVLKPYDICAIIQAIVSDHSYEKWHLAGFSMGARMVLGILPFMPLELGQLIFISPAGFNYSPSLSKLLFPLCIRRSFGSWLINGRFLPRFWWLLHKMHCISSQSYHIFARQVQTPDKRARMLYVWSMMYYFCNKISGKHWRYLDYSEKVILLCGKGDQVTPAQQVERLCANRNNVHFHLMEGDHFLLAKQGEQLRQFLLNNDYL